ncbi:MAG TPA: ABC transporter substrate-binding protein [Phycisphaerae bacterium]|nr:ABC transporter substrate-binding protein [Phycisphaerae bacterium]HNU46962.1 ABC transporter substrate-binding protein [Phycisphaerae bacterium]
MTPRRLTLGHSPDADDAFMFFGLAAGRVETRGWTFEHVLQDIQTLNDRAVRGELDITAISIHAYPYVARHYALTNCGASVGDGYGPLIVAREAMAPEALRGRRIAVPGKTTTAYLALSLRLGPGAFEPEVVPFDQILSHVAEGKADAGLIIHEGQLTYSAHRLHAVLDLGVWWKELTGLPLPLGGNCIRRDLGPAAMLEVAGILKAGIEYSLAHRVEALAHALQYARGLAPDCADRFVGMYVNDWTLDWGDAGRRAVRELLRRGHEAGIVPAIPSVDFVG